jgi:hypothetical protein
MILGGVVVFLAAYVAAAAWAAGRGRAPLAAVAALALAIVVLSALVLGHQYAVPSIPRLLLFKLAFVGPAVAVPFLLLWPRAVPGHAAGGAPLGLALLGAVGGLLAGWVIVVFGLGVW